MGEERDIPEEGTDVATPGGVQHHRALGKIGMVGTEGSEKPTRHEKGGRDKTNLEGFWKGLPFIL